MPSRADDAEYGTGRGHQRVSYMRKQRYVGVSTLAIHVCGKRRRSVRQCALLGDRVVRGHVRVIELHVLHVLCRHGGETFDRNTGVIRNFIAPLPRMKLCSIGLSQSRTVFVSGLPHNDAAVYTGTALRGSSLYGRHANSMFPCPNKKTSAADVRHRSKNSCPPAQRDYVPYAGLRVE